MLYIDRAWHTRSIPVHTGKPAAAAKSGEQKMVYPRTHGETRLIETDEDGQEGLSPYTRGNRP